MLNVVTNTDADQIVQDAIFEKKFTLYNDLPSIINEALANPEVQDIMVNPGGAVFAHAKGVQRKICEMHPEAMMRFCRKAGKIYGRKFDEDFPVLSAILPNNERLEAVYPTVSTDGLTFVLRRPGPVWTLDDLHEKRSMTLDQLNTLKDAAGEFNIVVSGWINAGKSTLVRAILAEPRMQSLRQVSIETDPEVQRPANGVRLVANSDADFEPLFKSTLRLNSQLIILSEVRMPIHVWALVDAATTGHLGVTTIHARSPLLAATRMHRIVQRVSTVPPEDIAMACEVVVHIAPTGDGNRAITEISKISTDGEKFVSEKLA